MSTPCLAPRLLVSARRRAVRSVCELSSSRATLHSVENPGYFNREIVIDACAAYGMKPICNHESYCDENAVDFSSQYLSQCADDQLPTVSADAQCIDLPFSFLHQTVNYNTANWNGDTFLSLDSSGSHSWRAFNSPQTTYTDTICVHPSTLTPLYAATYHVEPCDGRTLSGALTGDYSVFDAHATQRATGYECVSQTSTHHTTYGEYQAIRVNFK